MNAALLFALALLQGAQQKPAAPARDSGGFPGLPPGGMPGSGAGPDLSKLDPTANQLPPGFDPSKLNFGKKDK